MDLVYLGGIMVFYGLCVWLAAGCDRLQARPPGSRADASSALGGASRGDGRVAP